VGFSDALRNDATQYVGSTGTGSAIMRFPVVVDYLPPGGYVAVSISRAGVTFLDGTTVKNFTAADFTSGVLYVDLLYPQGMTGSYCHSVKVFDANNNFIGP
jgi:hypothetical protein